MAVLVWQTNFPAIVSFYKIFRSVIVLERFFWSLITKMKPNIKIITIQHGKFNMADSIWRIHFLGKVFFDNMFRWAVVFENFF